MTGITPVHKCQCRGDEEPGPNGTFWCQFHQCRKTAHWKHLCETRPKYREKWNEGHGMGQAVGGQSVVSQPGLGDRVESMLTKLGITEERYVEVKRLFGLPPVCNCAGRREWLNRVGRWLAEELEGNHGNQD